MKELKEILMAVLVILPFAAVTLLILGIKHRTDHLILGGAGLIGALVLGFWLMSQY
ncbi:hypothetical protein ACPT9H_18855 [Brevibacillus borstelensis]|jgi:hypothetical protein|uniref:hypothetical protein n=1 Tax=Brevibacillus borstelensis TaxID=45462 RepID=UPI003CE4E98F